MSKASAFEGDVLKLIFQAVAIGNLADNTGTSPAANITVALHTADPGEGGTQATSETAYTGYARVSVVRSAVGWTVSSASPTQVAPAANIDFGQCSASPGAAITYFSVGTGTANKMLYSGTVTPNITMAAGVIPRLTTASSITEG